MIKKTDTFFNLFFTVSNESYRYITAMA